MALRTQVWSWVPEEATVELEKELDDIDEELVYIHRDLSVEGAKAIGESLSRVARKVSFIQKQKDLDEVNRKLADDSGLKESEARMNAAMGKLLARKNKSPEAESWVVEAAMHVAAKNIREGLNLPGQVSEFDEKISETYPDTVISKTVSDLQGDESEQAKDLRADIALRIGFLTMEMGREPTAEEISEDEVILEILGKKLEVEKATSGIRKQNLAGKIKKASQDMGRK